MIGAFSRIDPVEPWNAASPKENTPPSAPRIQYPLPDFVGSSRTTGRLRRIPSVDPWWAASPYALTTPFDESSQYPSPLGVVAIDIAGVGISPAPPRYRASPNVYIALSRPSVQ